MNPSTPHKQKQDKAERAPSQADLCIEAASVATLFHCDGRAFARMPVDGHLETWPIHSSGFRQWLARTVYGQTGKAPCTQAIQDALNVIAGNALYGSDEHAVAVRLAGYGGKIYIDLAGDQWRVVEINGNGWRILGSRQCPVRFVRRRGMLPLPVPIKGGSIDELRELVNLPDDDDWIKVVAWAVGALRAVGPYTILAVNGEQGSAKSTLCRLLRALIDPNAAALRRPPRDARDLMIAATNGWCVLFDNLSGIAPSLSDELCCLATGGGFATRELYSDDEEKLFSAQRPILINGIDELATRPDLADRCLPLTLPTIPDHKRRDEADLLTRFEDARPRILGALLDAVSVAIANVDTVKLDRLPRMADFAKWVVAAEPALPWKAGAFMAAYERARHVTTESAIEASAIGPAIMGLMKGHERWHGTASELLTTLEAHHSDEAQRKRRGWPKSPKAMSNALRRLAPALRGVGINHTAPAPTDKGRIHRLENTGDAPPTPPGPPQNLDNSPKSAFSSGRCAGGKGDPPGGGDSHRPTESPLYCGNNGDSGGQGGTGGQIPVNSGRAWYED